MSSRKRRGKKEEHKIMFKQFCLKFTDKGYNEPKSNILLKNLYSISYTVGPQILGCGYTLSTVSSV